jgi:beta-glucosidase
MSFPYAVGQIPVYYAQKTTGRPQDPGNKFSSKYLDIPNEPLFPFGYGLSYTQFEYSDLKLSADKLTPGRAIAATVTVSNKGSVDGAEVVQLYIEDEVRSITPPAKELKGFRKLMLKAGESRQVEFRIDTEMLKFWNADLKWVAEPGAFKVHVGGNSKDTQFRAFKLN